MSTTTSTTTTTTAVSHSVGASTTSVVIAPVATNETCHELPGGERPCGSSTDMAGGPVAQEIDAQHAWDESVEDFGMDYVHGASYSFSLLAT